MFAKRGRVELYYELRGPAEGPPLLMLRGLGRTLRHWGALLDELAGDFRLVLMDNRGVGQSSAPLPPYSTRAMADDAKAVLDDAGVERANVFGMSLGGMIAQELALTSPGRVRALALGCTRAAAAAGSSPPASLFSLIAALRLSPEEAVARTAPLILSPAFLAAHPEVVTGWQALARETRPRRRGVLGQLLAAGRHDARARLPQLAMPTLLVSGDADRLIPHAASVAMARQIPSATLELLPGAGHDFATERPAQTAAILRRFFLKR